MFGSSKTSAGAGDCTSAPVVERCLSGAARPLLMVTDPPYGVDYDPRWRLEAGVNATGHWQGDRKQSTVWHIPNVHRTQGDVYDGRNSHSTQKPVEAMLRPTLNNSRAGETVYEPFCGSGTTIIAAETCGRQALAVELNPAYVDVAVMRWQNFSGETATLDGDGRSFVEIRAERLGDQHGEDRAEDDAHASQAAARQSVEAAAAGR